MNHELVFWGNGGQRQEQQTGTPERGCKGGIAPPTPFPKGVKGRKGALFYFGEIFLDLEKIITRSPHYHQHVKFCSQIH